MDGLTAPASPLHGLVKAEAAADLARSGGPQLDPALFGQPMGGAQPMAFLLQVDAWLRQYRVRVRVKAPVG